MVDVIAETEVEGSNVAIMKATETDDGSGGTTVQRSVLASASKDDLSLEMDEDDEDFNRALKRRTKRYRTNNTVDATVNTAVAVGIEALSELGIADSDTKLTTDSSARQWGDSTYLEFAFFADEPDFSDIDVVADSEMLTRMGGIKITSPSFDASSSPLMLEFTAWVEGLIYLDYPGPDAAADGGA